MERLTNRTAPWCSSGFIPASGEEQKMIDKLADYEDAKEQGRLIEFPVAVGDHVWCIPEEDAINDLTEMTVASLEHSECADYIHLETINLQYPVCFDVSYIGKMVFRTREEAEAKLKEKEADNANT